MLEAIQQLLASHYTWLFSGAGTTVVLGMIHVLHLARRGRTALTDGQVIKGLYALNFAKNSRFGQVALGIFVSNIGFHVGGQRARLGIVNFAHTVGHSRRKLSQDDYAEYLRMAKWVGIGLIVFAVLVFSASFGFWHLTYATPYNILTLFPVTFMFLFAMGSLFHGVILFGLGGRAALSVKHNE